uniref:Ribosome recycling factor domain-containing protein n=1 Tax=Leptocylindrus danicus TaxID=163516 RepID=A0A7S2KXT1_9STRA|mmetsp:Transcript_28426/g.41837  ORF Transcript_28426/g.41837 Transcript_28426/m.41837 type:complete len:310 (+) Transcript_28426:156-1085(+)|eukprot:CAMPEP_0116033822 /NCGR_PEP_ID=MMETSP0321-20121206/19226_1 /TAXON_ID=163516 /ORGANISM="Leptocylindrus danicus var. danicus, Strain B650" /LENGTH=309 /DNA_ID=CAMNT_0003509987 /DNA_START=87 /DNA_END=1016 /DNA_ORIENTATION=+
MMSRVASIVQVVYRAGARSRARSSPLSCCSSRSSSGSGTLLPSVSAAFTSAEVGRHDIYARHFHTSRSTLRKNKRSALAKHEAKMEQIEHEKVVEERRAKKQMEAEHKLARKKGMVPKNQEEDEEVDLPTQDDVKDEMMRVVESMLTSFKSIRGGEPSAELFENIMVDAYGTRTPLTGLAQVVVAGSNRVVLTPYDPSVANNVRDAVRDAGMSFNPQIEEGEVIVPIPKVSKETREILSKKIGKMAEENRQRVRNIRRSYHDHIKKCKDAGFSKDETFRCSKEIDSVTEDVLAVLNDEVDRKKESIMQV